MLPPFHLRVFIRSVLVLIVVGRLSVTLFAATAEVDASSRSNETETYLRELQSIIESARRSGDTQALADAAIAMAFDNFSSAPHRVELARAALEQAQHSGDDILRFAAQSALAQSLLYDGQVTEAGAVGMDAMETAQKIGHPALVVASLRLSGMIAARDTAPGMQNSAEDSLNIALDYYVGSDNTLEAAQTRTLLGDLFLRMNRAPEALAQLTLAEIDLRSLDGATHWLKALELKAIAESEVGAFQEAFNSTVELYQTQKQRWQSGLRDRLAELSVEHERALQSARADTLGAEKARSDLLRDAITVILVISLGGLMILSLLYFGKRRAEKALRETNRALALETAHHRDHIRELETANARLKEIDDERKRILGIAAHDLKNPIGCIGSSLEMIEEDCRRRFPQDASEMAELFGLCHESIDYLNDLIQNILRARTEENRAAFLQPRPLDPLPILEQVISLNELAARKKKMTLWIEMIEELWIEADPQGLRESLDNVVSNAVKYSFHGAAIRIRLSRCGAREVAIEVFDGGPGLRPEEFDKLFQPFTKLSARPTGGENSTGLGLSSVKMIVDAMNGSIEAENYAGGGACFRLRLREASPLTGEEKPAAMEDKSGDSPGGNLRAS